MQTNPDGVANQNMHCADTDRQNQACDAVNACMYSLASADPVVEQAEQLSAVLPAPSKLSSLPSSAF